MSRARGGRRERMRETGFRIAREAEGWASAVAQNCSTAARRLCCERESRGTRAEHEYTRPLEGKRIVVTRAPEQSRELLARLKTWARRCLLFPAVSFSEPIDTAALDRAIRSLDEFDWIVFTSANAVRFFAGALPQAGRGAERGGETIVAPRLARRRERRGRGRIFRRSRAAGI